MHLAPRKNIAWILALSAAVLSGAAPVDAPAPPPLPPMAASAGVVLGAVQPASARDVFVDYDALALPARSGGEWLTYDLDAVTHAVGARDLGDESELSLAVRLLLSEVGADRLVVNRYGLLEGVGILYTVDNRLDAGAYNPEQRPVTPIFPGCGPTGTFATCTNAGQYLGMATWRALDPGSRYDPALLEAAADVAVVAWWLQENRLVPDFTDGATNYTHRCGDAAYGLTTPHCDGHLGRRHRRGDVPGANPHTGPLVFRAPEVFLPRKGFYSLFVSRWVDYTPWWSADDPAADELAAVAEETGLDLAVAVGRLADGAGLGPVVAARRP